MPTPTAPLATTSGIAGLAAKLGVSPTDPALVSALTRASDRFRGEVRHPVSRVTDDVLEREGTRSTTLSLPGHPIVGPVILKLDDVVVTDFTVARSVGRLRRRGGFGNEFTVLEVTYTHGVEIESGLPSGIESAVLDQAEATYNADAGISQTGAAGEQVSYGQAHTVGVTTQWTEAVAANQRSTAGGA